MRTILLAALLASTTSPAIAAMQDRGDRRSEARSERSERAEARAERRARAAAERSEESEAQRDRAAKSRPDRPFAPRASEAPAGAASETEERASLPREGERPGRRREGAEDGGDRDGVRDWRPGERRSADGDFINLRRGRTAGEGSVDLVEQRRPLPPVLDRDGRRRPISRTPVAGTEPPPPPTAAARHARPDRHWRHDWRGDRRFDWRDYRRRHRSRFHLGFYYDPFGWSYRRYGIGWRLWPSYYSNRYWLHDPWMYRLPPAYGPYRWVRYWDDALLVNIYTGEVVDVIHNFFW